MNANITNVADKATNLNIPPQFRRKVAESTITMDGKKDGKVTDPKGRTVVQTEADVGKEAIVQETKH